MYREQKACWLWRNTLWKRLVQLIDLVLFWKKKNENCYLLLSISIPDFLSLLIPFGTSNAYFSQGPKWLVLGPEGYIALMPTDAESNTHVDLQVPGIHYYTTKPSLERRGSGKYIIKEPCTASRLTLIYRNFLLTIHIYYIVSLVLSVLSSQQEQRQ